MQERFVVTHVKQSEFVKRLLAEEDEEPPAPVEPSWILYEPPPKPEPPPEPPPEDPREVGIREIVSEARQRPGPPEPGWLVAARAEAEAKEHLTRRYPSTGQERPQRVEKKDDFYGSKLGRKSRAVNAYERRWVFVSKHGKRLSAPTVSQMWAVVKAAAGLDFDFYEATKHYGVCRLYTAGVSPRTNAHMAGWSESAVESLLRVYGHPNVAAQAEIDACTPTSARRWSVSQQRGMVRLTFEKWHEHLAELEGLRRENEDLRRRLGDVVWERQVARLLRGQEQLREENKRLRIERDDLQRALRRLETDAQPSHEDDDPAS